MILTAADISCLEEFRGEQNQAVVRKGIGKPVGGSQDGDIIKLVQGSFQPWGVGVYPLPSLGGILEPFGGPEQEDGWHEAS